MRRGHQFDPRAQRLPDIVTVGVGVRPVEPLFVQVQFDWVGWDETLLEPAGSLRLSPGGGSIHHESRAHPRRLGDDQLANGPYGTISSGWCASNRALDANPDAVKGFVRAILKAQAQAQGIAPTIGACVFGSQLAWTRTVIEYAQRADDHPAEQESP